MATYIWLDGVPPGTTSMARGEPLVLLHPGGADARAFAPNLDALAAHFHVFTPDRRGHGHSHDVDGPITYEPMAQDTIAFLEAVVGGSATALIGRLVGGGGLWAPGRGRQVSGMR